MMLFFSIKNSRHLIQTTLFSSYLLACTLPATAQDARNGTADHLSRAKNSTPEASRLEAINDSVFKRLLAKARLYAKQHDYTSAIQAFCTCLELHKDSVDTLNERGQCHYYSGSYDQAIADFCKAQSLSPKNPLPYIWLARISEGKGEITAALRHTDEGLKSVPNSDLFLARTCYLFLLGKYQESAKTARSGLKIKPTDFNLQNMQVLAMDKIDHQSTVSKLNAQLRTDPKNVNFLQQRALVRMSHNNYSAANLDYARAVSLAPRRKDIKYNWACSLTQTKGQQKKAIKLMTEMIDPSMDNEDRFNMMIVQQLTSIYFAKKDYVSALSYANKAIAVDKSPSNLNQRFSIFYAIKRWKEAQKDCEDWVSICPKSALALGSLYNCNIQGKNYKAALDIATKLNTLFPGTYFYELGLAHECLQQYDEAVHDFQEYHKRNPKNIDALRHIANLYLSMENTEEALKTTSLILDSHPHDYDLLFQLAHIYNMQNKKAESLRIAREMVRFHPGRYDSWRIASEACLNNGFFQEAKGYNAHAARLKPANIKTQIEAVQIELALGHQNLALKKLNQLCKTKISEPELLVERGMAFVSVDMLQEALRADRPTP